MSFSVVNKDVWVKNVFSDSKYANRELLTFGKFKLKKTMFVNKYFPYGLNVKLGRRIILCLDRKSF